MGILHIIQMRLSQNVYVGYIGSVGCFSIAYYSKYIMKCSITVLGLLAMNLISFLWKLVDVR